MSKETGRAARGPQARGEMRMEVRLDAALDWRGGEARCRVHDLSRGGACLESDAPVRSGERVVFIRAALRVSGTVAWARGRRFGVSFNAPIRATDLFLQMSDSRAKAAHPPITVGLKPLRDTQQAASTVPSS